MENQENSSGQQTFNIQIPSADNIASRRPLIPVSFAFAIILFFFSFCDFKCGGQKIGSVTGINLVTGTELKDRDLFSGKETKGEEIPASIWAILAFGAALVGLGAFLIKEKREALIGTGSGAVGFGSLLILQFVIKNTVEKEGNGQLEADFQFAYWASVLALGFAGFISYLRMQKIHNIVVKVSPQAANSPHSEENLSQTQTTVNRASQTSNFDIGEWLGKNKKVIIAVLSAVIAIYCVYYFFLRHDPAKDAKKSAVAYCDCSTKYNDAMIKVNEKFVNSFESYSFKKRQEARSKLQELETSVMAEQSKCSSEAQKKYDELRNRYVAKQQMLLMFDYVYNAQSVTCNPSNQSDLTTWKSKVENKITNIQDPEPDIEKIKSDLIGQQIPGWRFAYLNEFQSGEIINTTRGNDRIEFQIKFHLTDNSANSEHDCEILAVYLQGEKGWYFDNVEMISITYLNTAPVNQWEVVRPLHNCKYSILDQGHNYRVRDGYWGPKYECGPGKPAFNSTNSEIYIQSMENRPIDLIFKYFPNN